MPSNEFNYGDGLTVAFVDAVNSTPYYNFSFCHELGKRCNVIFYTSEYIHENIAYPQNVRTKSFFFPLSCFLSTAFNSRKIRKTVRALEYPIGLMRLIWNLIREKPDVIHFNWILVPLLDLLLIRLLKKRGVAVVYTAHNASPHDKSNVHAGAQAAILNLCDRIICLTDYVNEELIKAFKVSSVKIDVIPHGNFDFVVGQAKDTGSPATARLRKLLDDSFVLSFLGQIRPYKGVEYLIRAMPLILKDCPGCKLLIFGNDTHNLAKTYHELIDDLNLNSNVICDFRYIPLNEMVMYLRLTDIVILPYITASQSGHIPMLSKMGIPVIASRAGGLPEMIQEGRNGFLVPPGDEAAIADVVCRLFRDAELLDRMRRDSVAYAEEAFSWNRIVAKTLLSYEKTSDRFVESLKAISV